MQLELLPFEASPTTTLFDSFVTWKYDRSSSKIAIEFKLQGPVTTLEYAKTTSPIAKDELWNQTCFEVFLKKTGGNEYEEWNFSPSGDYQRYRFHGYRNRDFSAPAPDTSEFEVSWAKEPNTFQARCQIFVPYEISHLQLCMVLKTTHEPPSHWAIKHSKAKADFHNHDLFHEVP